MNGKRRKAPDRVEIMRRRRRKRLLTTALIVVLLIVAAVLSLTVFFNITAIEINGESTVYTTDEISQSLKIKAGQNIFLFSTNKAEQEIMQALPYLENVKVVRKLPGTVIIDISETRTSLALPYSGGCLILSESLKIAENVSTVPENLTRIYGIVPNSHKVGSMLATDAETGTQYLEIVISTLSEHDLLAKTSIINVSDKLNLSIVYDGRIFVMLGTANNIDYKVSMLGKLVNEEIGPDETGELDLSLAGKGIFKAGELVLPEGYENTSKTSR